MVAYELAGRTDDARRAIDRVTSTPWPTPDFYEAAGEVYESAGDAERAAEARARRSALMQR